VSDKGERRLSLNTFIVRFWREPGADRARWYGQVQCVQSGERVHFADEAALLSFIRRWVQMSGEGDSQTLSQEEVDEE
jgi:hypothetical protein